MPQSSEAHRAIGEAHYEDRDFAAAERAYRAGLALNPNDVTGMLSLANTRERQGDRDEAMEWRERAIARDPLNANAIYVLGVTAASDKTARAEQLADRLLELEPDYGRSYSLAGVVSLYKGDLKVAYDAYLQMLRLGGSTVVGAIQFITWLLIGVGHAERADQVLACAIEMAPNNAIFYDLRITAMQARLPPSEWFSAQHFGVLAFLQRREDALYALARAYEQSWYSQWIIDHWVEQGLDDLAGDIRFQDIMGRMKARNEDAHDYIATLPPPAL